MKYLKEGDYYINLAYPSFRSVIDDEDFTDMIGDFSRFSYLGVDVMGDTIRLINTLDNGFIFVHYPSVDGRFIRANEILKFKEEKDMEEMGKKSELTLEERVKQLEKEKESLQIRIKNQAMYDKMRKAGDDLAIHMKAMQDSGFSREEAMQILMTAAISNMIPPFLRR